MEFHSIPNDDIMDAVEITTALEDSMYQILQDVDVDIALSSLMSAAINCIIAQCDDLEEALFYRNLFIKFLDRSIGVVNIKGQKKPLDD